MTTNKPEIIGYVPTKDGKLRCGEDGFCLDEYTDQLRDNPAGLKLEPVILFREYEALQSECKELRTALAESRANDLTAMGYLSQIRQLVGGDDFPDMVRRCEKLQAENALLRAAIRRLCNLYEVDDYYMGQLREDRLDAAVNQAIEQVKETT